VITVSRLAPGDQWDQTFLDDLFDNRLYPTGLEFRRVNRYPPGSDGAILLIPGRYWSERGNQISEAISRLPWVLGIRTSDEADTFDAAERIYHPNIRWWIQTPRTDVDHGDARLFGVGYSPHFVELPADPVDKHLEVFLSAQNNHTRRAGFFSALQETATRIIRETPGFTEGMPAAQYADQMRYARIAPAPSGVFSPDSFRVWEALEAHAIPIADDISPQYRSAGYWNALLPDAPFPIITNPDELPGLIDTLLTDWPANANRVAAWWIRQKRRIAHWLLDDLRELGAAGL
jgi:hypothetical protein